jgi:hypothetical protein
MTTAIAVLLQVENNRTGLLVILAGYKDKMEVLIGADPGMKRRFGTQLDLQDYTGPELAEMARRYALREFNMVFEDGLVEQLGTHIQVMHSGSACSDCTCSANMYSLCKDYVALNLHMQAYIDKCV